MEIVIRIDNNAIHFNPTWSIPLGQSNISKGHLTFKEIEPIYWKAEVMKYDKSHRIFLKVLQYNCYDIKSFETLTKKGNISEVYFEPFDWQQLEPLLSVYHKAIIKHLILNPAIEEAGENKSYSNRSMLRIDFSAKFSDARFMLGHVSIDQEVKEIGKIVSFKIPNDNILPEFDHIKFWFSKVLKTKKFRITATISAKDRELFSFEAHSAEIDKITADIIDSVKQQRTYGILKKAKVLAIDKSLFTSDEIFDQFEDKSGESNAFKQSEYDILQMLSEGGKIRNQKQLIYLSGAKQTARNKLRFTLAPNFGFLFLVEGERHNHFVWELLNSHATYIWTIGKSAIDIQLQYKRIEECINVVRDSGREEYKRAYRQSDQDHDLIFNVIEHNNASSQLIDGFPKWKSRLEEILI